MESSLQRRVKQNVDVEFDLKNRISSMFLVFMQCKGDKSALNCLYHERGYDFCFNFKKVSLKIAFEIG